MIIRLGTWTVKQVRDESTQNRGDQTENRAPQKRHMHLQGPVGNEPGDQSNDDIPKKMKHVMFKQHISATRSLAIAKIESPQRRDRDEELRQLCPRRVRVAGINVIG